MKSPPDHAALKAEWVKRGKPGPSFYDWLLERVEPIAREIQAKEAKERKPPLRRRWR